MLWGGGGQDVFQRPRVHVGMSAPFSQSLSRDQPQDRATRGPILTPAPR